MSDEIEASEDLAGWLKDVGRRKWRPPQSSESNQGNQGNRATESSKDLVRRREVVKDTVLLLCLLTAYTQYNFLDVSLQIARLPSTVIFVPLDARSVSAPHSGHARRGEADQAGQVS